MTSQGVKLSNENKYIVSMTTAVLLHLCHRTIQSLTKRMTRPILQSKLNETATFTEVSVGCLVKVILVVFMV